MAEALLEIFPDHLREELAFNQNRYFPKTSNNIFRDVHNNEVARKRQLVKEAKAKEKDTGSPYSDQNKQLSKQL